MQTCLSARTVLHGGLTARRPDVRSSSRISAVRVGSSRGTQVGSISRSKIELLIELITLSFIIASLAVPSAFIIWRRYQGQWTEELYVP